jgi:hypothetical protein
MSTWKKNLSLALGLAIVGYCCVALSSEKIADKKIEPSYHTLAELSYGNESVGGTGSILWKAGFTVATMKSEKKGNTELLLSTAFDVQDKESRDLRMHAITKKGKKIDATSFSCVMGGGRKTQVVTLVCEFAAESETIDKLVIEQMDIEEKKVK